MAFERPILNRELPDFVERNTFNFDPIDFLNIAGSPNGVTTALANIPIAYTPGVRWTVDECLVRIPPFYSTTASATTNTLSAQLVKYVPEQFSGTNASAFQLMNVPAFANRSSTSASLAVTASLASTGTLIPVSQVCNFVGSTGPFGYDPNPLTTTNTYYRPRTSAVYGTSIPVSATGFNTAPVQLGLPIDPGLAGIAAPADQPLLASDGTRATVGGRVFNLSDNVMNPYDVLFLQVRMVFGASVATWGSNVFVGGIATGGSGRCFPISVMLRARQRRS